MRGGAGLSRRKFGFGALGAVGLPIHALTDSGQGDRRLGQAQARAAAPAWRTLPPTPTLPSPDRSGTVEVGSAHLFFASFGEGEPVLLLHGGGANSNYWGHVVPTLAARARVIAIDTRGHGRSTLGGERLAYARIANDVLAVMAGLMLQAAAVVGWSDGGIAGLNLAMVAPDRVTRLFTFGANTSRAGLRPDARAAPTVRAFEARCAAEYAALSPRPQDYALLQRELRRMWRDEPDYTVAELAGIRAPTTVAAGEHDEYIRPSHTQAIAAAIPGARVLIEPGVSHFAMLQDPAMFAADLVRFLEP